MRGDAARARLAALALAGALAAADPLAAQAADPRPRLVELSLEGRLRDSLAEVERVLASDPARARDLGLDLLRGDLLERLGAEREATEAFAQALGPGSRLAPWARYRLARAQERVGHPEVAAGIIATLLGAGAPDGLERRSLEMLRRTLEAGGDCRLLGGIPRDLFTGDARRLYVLVELGCRARDGAPPPWPELRSYLEQKTDDAWAWDAVAPFLERPGVELPEDRTTLLLLGLTAFHHREFELALRLLELGGAGRPRAPFDTLASAAAYAEARSHFWLGRYERAAELFRRISLETRLEEPRADALYQQGRAKELAGDVDGAHEAFVSASLVQPRGDWGGAALVSLLRLEYAAGDFTAARRRLTLLQSTPAFASYAARGALFLAVSELVRGRPDRVAGLLAAAERTREASPVELAYWRGRLAERTGDLDGALDAYLEAAAERPFHPLAVAARARWSAPPLAAAAASRAERLAASGTPRELWAASVLAAREPEREARRQRGVALLASSGAHAVWIDGARQPVESWPLWRSRFDRPEDHLLALGLAADAPGSVGRHFPVGSTRLGLTGASLLAGGPATRNGIALAESVFSRRPREVPLEWVDARWLRLLYPLPWADVIRTQAAARGIEPELLAAMIREESRFDPLAVSPASARGLSQFVLPTARRLAAAGGLATLGAHDLHDPLVAIPLGASYLAELARRFQGEPTAMAAAYNAGEEQTALWRRFCQGSEPEELLAKIGFGETRAYVARLLESRNAYRSILELEAAPRTLASGG
jgi:soluble lytic murein transglycosylase